MMAMEVSERERFDMFVESARAFCSWIEGLPELPSDGLWDLDEAPALISALLADGHRLPVVAPTDAEIADVPMSEWSAVHRRTLAWTEASDNYWTVEPGGSEPSEATLGSIADDLADTWRDLRGCLTALDSGSLWQDVSWQFRFDMTSHWRKHVVEALRALHHA